MTVKPGAELRASMAQELPGYIYRSFHSTVTTLECCFRSQQRDHIESEYVLNDQNIKNSHFKIPRKSEVYPLIVYKRSNAIPSRLLYLLVFIMICIQGTQGCLPSFREERSAAEALEGSGSFVTNEFDDQQLIAHSKSGNSPPPTEEEGEEEDEEEEYRDTEVDDDVHHHLSSSYIAHLRNNVYGDAPEIKNSDNLEKAKRRIRERECPGFCFRGECSVDIDIETHEFVSKKCNCPHGYNGERCELNFSISVFSHIRSQNIQIEKSAVSAIIFLCFLASMIILLAFYVFRKISRRPEDWLSPSSTLVLTEQVHLRRDNLCGYSLPTLAPKRGAIRMPFTPTQRYNRLNINWTPSPPAMESTGNLSSPHTTIDMPPQLTILSNESCSTSPTVSSKPLPLTSSFTNQSISTTEDEAIVSNVELNPSEQTESLLDQPSIALQLCEEDDG